MSQSYFPGASRVTSPPPEKESAFAALGGDKLNQDRQFKVEDVQEAYVEHKDRLVNAIDSTKSILSSLREFNKDEWVVRYPQLRDPAPETAPSSSGAKRPGLRHAMTFADDPSAEHEVVMKPSRKGLRRSLTLAAVGDAQDEEHVGDAPADLQEPAPERLIPTSDASDFQVLRLDLKLGPHGSTTSAASLVSQLEKASIAHLLDERLAAASAHIDKLRARVEDTSSKVLVTGDLNAGKSTFVNALLRREVMPVDQQPCTTAFCEVHDAAENGGVEEVHVLKEGATYSIKDESTYSRGKIADLDNFVTDNEQQPKMKLYLADTRAPSESLLNNGVVDISLIDAPGLNRDSLKTTAVFSRQEEIDVVVFVVSAENHFTLSAKEFLWNASNEKAYVFIVVNKFDQIKNKEKCKRLVLEQIRQLSPGTFEDAEDLVHFVDSATALQPYTANPAFDDLESSLRSFVLVKRSKSKLNPAANYISNILSDVDILAGANAIVANSEKERAEEDLKRARPVLEKMKDGRESLEDGLESVEETGATKALSRTKEALTHALDLVGQGKLAVEKGVSMPSYPGLLSVFDYARDVRRALLQSLDLAVKLSEDEARTITSTGVSGISKLGDAHLPEDVERSKRVFMPEAMFSARASKKGSRNARKASSMMVPGGTHGLGLGLAQRPEMLETSFFDILDVNHQFWVHFGDEHKENEDESGPSALGVVSVGIGALTMVGGQTLGARGVIEGIVRVADLLGNESARRWAAPVIGAVTIGLTAYFVLELPASIPRTVGRRIRASLNRPELDGAGDDTLFVPAHAVRVSRETRKVLRLASWDLRERFRGALEERAREVKGAEEAERRAGKALEFFRGVEVRTGEVRENAGLVGSV